MKSQNWQTTLYLNINCLHLRNFLIRLHFIFLYIFRISRNRHEIKLYGVRLDENCIFGMLRALVFNVTAPAKSMSADWKISQQKNMQLKKNTQKKNALLKKNKNTGTVKFYKIYPNDFASI